MINTVRVIKLSCVGCGSNLDISQDMNKLACGHCGTQQIVERSGGAIHLRGVAEALSKVQVGTDRTAAELAISRISKELEEGQYQRAENENYWMSIRNQKLYDWNTHIRSNESTIKSYTVLGAFLGALPSAIIAFIIYSFLKGVSLDADIAVMPSAIFIIVGCLVAAAFVRQLLLKNDKYNPEKLQAECNKDIAKLDREISRDLGEVDKRIAELNTRLRQNYQVANS